MSKTETINEAFVKWQAGDMTDEQYADVIRGTRNKPKPVKKISEPKDEAPAPMTPELATAASKAGRITWARLEDGTWGICWESGPPAAGYEGILVTARRKDGAAKEVTLGPFVKEFRTKDGRNLFFYRVEGK